MKRHKGKGGMAAKRHGRDLSAISPKRRQLPASSIDTLPLAPRPRRLEDRVDQNDGDTWDRSPKKRGHKRGRESMRSPTTGLYQDRVSPVLRGQELAQFKTWIDNSAEEPPAVAGAGSVVRWPDSELAMFHATQSVLPLPIDPAVIAAVSGVKSRQRPRSWDAKSPQPRKSLRQADIESMMRQREEELPVRLPELKGQANKTAMLNLLAECKS